jgi:membrane-associated protease RseP (regulator of RpoE activity)
MIFHRRVPAHLENMIHVIGLMLLLLFMVYVNLQDFIHPLELPH